MNKAEAIEAMKNKYVYWQNAVGIINSIQPTTDEALKVLGENYQMTSEQYEEIWGKGMDYGMADRLIKEKTGRSLWDHVQDNFADFNKPQKVVIPKFVAEWWEWSTVSDGLFDYILKYRWNECAAYDDFIPSNVLDWMFDSDDSIVLALRLITGELDYEVEKEKLYRVEFPGMHPNDVKHYWIRNGEYIGLQNTHDGRKSDDCRFTEQQIKAIDERYFAFAVEVEETDNEI